ncbi:subunit of heterodimeric actin capping protein cap32/34 [Pelomyxa schiedti]|nr:subunit of heterodimeric actin capping protein cap32/34 [Pelomyxa schiedti]KAH3760073.1 subunit of heterodimeric actin capping protein cap32/34 [Pelomyxa schiedti]
MAADGPTDAELVDIATRFLMNAPPGEFLDVVTDVRRLLPNESLLNSTAAATFKEYNCDQMVQVDAPGGTHKVLISKYGEVGENEYVDPVGQQVLQFDHIKQEVLSARPLSGELSPDLEPARAAIEKQALTYCVDHYPNGTATVYSSRAENAIFVCISSAKFSPSNFWNGRWRAEWKVVVAKSGNMQLSGRIRVQVHYYEDGNVQLQTDTTKKCTAPGAADPTALATNAMKAIIKVEQAFHQALDTSYTTMGETSFKALRRALPVTHSKIKWEAIRTYRVGTEVGSSSSS